MKMSLPWGTENGAFLEPSSSSGLPEPMDGFKQERDSRERPSTGIRECEGIGVC